MITLANSSLHDARSSFTWIEVSLAGHIWSKCHVCLCRVIRCLSVFRHVRSHVMRDWFPTFSAPPCSRPCRAAFGTPRAPSLSLPWWARWEWRRRQDSICRYLWQYTKIKVSLLPDRAVRHDELSCCVFENPAFLWSPQSTTGIAMKNESWSLFAEISFKELEMGPQKRALINLPLGFHYVQGGTKMFLPWQGLFFL